MSLPTIDRDIRVFDAFVEVHKMKRAPCLLSVVVTEHGTDRVAFHFEDKAAFLDFFRRVQLVAYELECEAEAPQQGSEVTP